MSPSHPVRRTTEVRRTILRATTLASTLVGLSGCFLVSDFDLQKGPSGSGAGNSTSTSIGGGSQGGAGTGGAGTGGTGGTAPSCEGTKDCSNAGGFCVDGICCDAPCNGPCETCSPSGVCGPVPAGTDPKDACDADGKCGPTGACDGTSSECAVAPPATPCGASTCSVDQFTPAPACDGFGTCKPGTASSCGTYACNAAGTGCLATCTVPADCAATAYCVNHVCTDDNMVGTSCSGPGTCPLGFCVDGYCCASACTDGCHACSGALTGGANGQCAPVADSTDPKNACLIDSPSSCGTTGVCEGGACQLYPNGEICSSGGCNGNGYDEMTCDGAGLCGNNLHTDCFGSDCCQDFGNGPSCYPC